MNAADEKIPAPPHDPGRSTWGDLQVLGPNHISTLARYWLSRSYAAMMTLALLLGSWFEPNALSHQLYDRSGFWGWFIAGVVGLVCVFALFEVVLDDFMPPRYTMVPVKRNRHLIYLAIAMGNAIIAFLFIYESGGWYRGLILPYLVNVTLSFGVAWLDLLQRHRAPQ